MGNDDYHDADKPWHHRNKDDLNSKIMLTAIISLSLVVVLVTLLQIYARCILKRQSRRRVALRQFGIVAATTHVSSIDPPKTGLDPSVVASLPVFVFRKSSDDTNGSSHTTSSEMVGLGSVECSVCLCMLEDGDMARTLPNCKHTFHAECIDKWFSTQSTCPICRTEAEPILQIQPPEKSEGVSGSGDGISPRILPTAPPLDQTNSTSLPTTEGASSQKIMSGNNESSSRLSSFRRILTRERSSNRVHCGQEDTGDDLERQ